MKKIYFLIALAGIALSACKPAVVEEPKEPAALMAQGSYEGTWTIVSSDVSFGVDGKLEGIAGTLSIDTVSTKEEELHMAKITIYRGALSETETETWEKTAIANIAHAAGDVVFNNDLASNGFGSIFYGRTLNEMQQVTISCAFTDKIADPAHPGKKKNVVNSYVFKGNKQ